MLKEQDSMSTDHGTFGTLNSPPVRGHHQIMITDEDASMEDLTTSSPLIRMSATDTAHNQNNTSASTNNLSKQQAQHEIWDDLKIDQEAKTLLKERRLG